MWKNSVIAVLVVVSAILFVLYKDEQSNSENGWSQVEKLRPAVAKAANKLADLAERQQRENSQTIYAITDWLASQSAVSFRGRAYNVKDVGRDFYLKDPETGEEVKLRFQAEEAGIVLETYAQREDGSIRLLEIWSVRFYDIAPQAILWLVHPDDGMAATGYSLIR